MERKKETNLGNKERKWNETEMEGTQGKQTREIRKVEQSKTKHGRRKNRREISEK